MSGESFLKTIKMDLEAGKARRCAGSTLLAEFDYVRRRQSAIKIIRDQLASLGLDTQPTLDTDMPLSVPQIRFFLTSNGPASQLTDTAGADHELPETELVPVPSFAAQELIPDGQEVATVKMEDLLEKAKTKMAAGGYSQLVVADGHDNFEGMISYRSIMLSSFKKTPERVKDCLEPDPVTVLANLNLSDTLRRMGNHDAVTLVDSSGRVNGIITTWDLAGEFSKIYEPFKLLENIEFKLKERIGSTYEPAQIAEFVNGDDYEIGQTLTSSQLTFGQMVRVVESESRWEDLGTGLDRGPVIEELKKAVATRNDLMHFRDADPSDISRLRRIWDMFRQAL